jgi:hypothetical protein
MTERANYQRAYYVANKERLNAQTKAYYKNNKPYLAEKMRLWRAKNKDRLRANREANKEAIAAKAKAYRQKYKDRRLQVERRRRGMPEPTRPCPKQCESCGRVPVKMGLHLDHCHVTGKFRGWLCGNCNSAIGKLGDNIDGVYRAVAYLLTNG